MASSPEAMPNQGLTRVTQPRQMKGEVRGADPASAAHEPLVPLFAHPPGGGGTGFPWLPKCGTGTVLAG